MNGIAIAVLTAVRLCPQFESDVQSNERAQMLLDNMHFFSVSHTLLAYGQGEAVVMVMMRFVEAAAILGEAFFRWVDIKYTSRNHSKQKLFTHASRLCFLPLHFCLIVAGQLLPK